MKKLPIKVKWGYVPTDDAEERLQAAFDIIFGQIEKPLAKKLPPFTDSDPETQEIPGQLSLF